MRFSCEFFIFYYQGTDRLSSGSNRPRSPADRAAKTRRGAGCSAHLQISLFSYFMPSYFKANEEDRFCWWPFCGFPTERYAMQLEDIAVVGRHQVDLHRVPSICNYLWLSTVVEISYSFSTINNLDTV